MQWMQIAHSFLRSVSNLFPLFHFKLTYVVLHMAVKDFSKPTSKNGEMSSFDLFLLMESYLADLEMTLFYSI